MNKFVLITVDFGRWQSVLRWISTVAYLAQTKSPKIRPSDLGA